VQSGGNGADVTGVLGFLGFALYIALMLKMFLPLLGNIPFFSPKEKTAEVAQVRQTATPFYPVGYVGVSRSDSSAGQAVIPSSTPFMMATATPYPTYTPYPTFTPSVDWLQGLATPTRNSFEPYQVNFVYSYYWPPLVSEPGMEANCHPDNYLFPDWDAERTKIIGCKDTTASGLPWSQYEQGKAVDGYAGGLAVPFYPDTFSPLYPMGTVLVVDSPMVIAGRYLVIDICSACDDYIHTNGVLFLDFVDDGLPPGVTFWDPVRVSEAIYP